MDDTRTPAQRLTESIDRPSGMVRLDLLLDFLNAGIARCTNAVMDFGVDERKADHWRGKAAAHRELLSALTTTPTTTTPETP
jgi:hypothetical protein